MLDILHQAMLERQKGRGTIGTEKIVPTELEANKTKKSQTMKTNPLLRMASWKKFLFELRLEKLKKEN